MGILVSVFSFFLNVVIDVVLFFLTGWMSLFLESREAGLKGMILGMLFFILIFGSIILGLWLTGGLDKTIDELNAHKEIKNETKILD